MRKVYPSMLAAVAASLLLFAVPAWAAHNHHLGAGHHTTVGKSSKHTGATKHAGPITSSAETGTSSHPSNNKGGATRGLERANQVAGEHGEAGRTNAAHHGHHHH